MYVDIHGYVLVTCVRVCVCVVIYRGNPSYSKCHDQFHTLSGKVVLLMCNCENVCVHAAVFEYLKLTWLTPTQAKICCCCRLLQQTS